MNYTNDENTQLFLIGLLHRPSDLSKIPVALREKCSELFALINDEDLVEAIRSFE
jgi:hypothetical protein